MLQMERRPPWADPGAFERGHDRDDREDVDDAVTGGIDPAEQEVGPNA